MQTREVNIKIFTVALVAPAAALVLVYLLWLWYQDHCAGWRKKSVQKFAFNSYFIQLYRRTTQATEPPQARTAPMLSGSSVYPSNPRKTRLTANELLQLSFCHFSSGIVVVASLFLCPVSIFNCSEESEKMMRIKCKFTGRQSQFFFSYLLLRLLLFYFHLNLHISLNGPEMAMTWLVAYVDNLALN